jgi:hypothetical protein
VTKNLTYVNIECFNTTFNLPTTNSTDDVMEIDDYFSDISTETEIPVVQIDQEMTKKLKALPQDNDVEKQLKDELNSVMKQYLFEKRRISNAREQLENEMELLRQYESNNEVKFKNLIERHRTVLENFQNYMKSTYGDLYTTNDF